MSKEYIYNKNLPFVKKAWKGNIIIDGQFSNNGFIEKPPIWDVLKWKLRKNPQKEAKKNDKFQLESIALKGFSKTIDSIVWLGHASFLISINGVVIIIDPCFYNVSFIKRKVAIPIEIEKISGIDFLLISHDHRDHFDKRSIQTILKNNPNIEVLTGLKIRELFKKNQLNISSIQEAGWYQSYQIDKDIRIVFTPAHHWGRRGLSDYNKYLWGGFMIMSGEKKIFFSGDTAYSPIFKEIHTEFGDIDYCLLPIGAYSPAFMMKDSHTTPEEAFQIFIDLKGKTFIPMHYGTYDLSDEPLGEPIRRLKQCFDTKNKNKLNVLTVGKAFDF